MKVAEREEEVDLFSLLAGTRDMLAVQANARGLWLTLHITPRVPQFITSDSRSLEQILVNLAGNALKFTQAGHVTIFADAVETAPGRIKLRIEVSDTGIGIAPEAQARIFESFTQADETIIDRSAAAVSASPSSSSSSKPRAARSASKAVSARAARSGSNSNALSE